MAKMTLYICGPMTGKTDRNYPAFNDAEATLKQAGYDVLNPTHIDTWHQAEERHCPTCHKGDEHTWAWYMARSLLLVRRSHGIAVLDGWASSAGAKQEISLALHIGKPLAIVPVWVSRKRTLMRDYGA